MHLRSSIILVFLFVFFTPFCGSSKEKAVIKLEQADKFIGENINGVTINFLSGNVILIHDSTTFYCDSAELNRQHNTFKAYGHIYTLMSDSIQLHGNRLTYDGNTRITHVFGNVKLVDDKTTLYTDHLIYFRQGRKGVFDQGGRVVDGENELTSQVGEYYSALKDFFFRKDVVVTTPDYLIKSDTLKYNSETEFIQFNGYSTLKGEADFMFAYKGWSDTKNNITSLKKHATVQHKQQIIYGDSVFFDKGREYGYATKNAVLMDTEKEVVVEGQTVEYVMQQGFAYVTDSAFATLVGKNDSLFLHSDTLKILFDTADKADLLLAYNKSKFYRKDMQGACDSLVYDLNDSIISMYDQPILWSEKNQLTSEFMKIFMTNQTMDSLVLNKSAFIVSVDSLQTDNQIKGRDIIAYFKNNEMYKITVNGNSETVYYIREEETKELVGVNKARSSNMVILLEDQQIVSILYLSKPTAVLYPELDISLEDQILKGFQWLDKMRPKSKKEIFNKL